MSSEDTMSMVWGKRMGEIDHRDMYSPFFSQNIDRATPGTHFKFLPCPTENHRARQFDQSSLYTPIEICDSRVIPAEYQCDSSMVRA